MGKKQAGKCSWIGVTNYIFSLAFWTLGAQLDSFKADNIHVVVDAQIARNLKQALDRRNQRQNQVLEGRCFFPKQFPVPMFSLKPQTIWCFFPTSPCQKQDQGLRRSRWEATGKSLCNCITHSKDTCENKNNLLPGKKKQRMLNKSQEQTGKPFLDGPLCIFLIFLMWHAPIQINGFPP